MRIALAAAAALAAVTLAGSIAPASAQGLFDRGAFLDTTQCINVHGTVYGNCRSNRNRGGLHPHGHSGPLYYSSRPRAGSAHPGFNGRRFGNQHAGHGTTRVVRWHRIQRIRTGSAHPGYSGTGARPLNEPYVAPRVVEVRGGNQYTGRACQRRDGSRGAEGYQNGVLGCFRH